MGCKPRGWTPAPGEPGAGAGQRGPTPGASGPLGATAATDSLCVLVCSTCPPSCSDADGSPRPRKRRSSSPAEGGEDHAKSARVRVVLLGNPLGARPAWWAGLLRQGHRGGRGHRTWARRRGRAGGIAHRGRHVESQQLAADRLSRSSGADARAAEGGAREQQGGQAGSCNVRCAHRMTTRSVRARATA